MERECAHHHWSRREFESQAGYHDYKECHTCGLHWDSYDQHPNPVVYQFDGVRQSEVDEAIASITKTIEERA